MFTLDSAEEALAALEMQTPLVAQFNGQRGVIASIRGRSNCLFMFDNPRVRMQCAGGADTALPVHWSSLGLPDAAAAAAFRARQPGIRRAKQAGAAAAFRIPYPAGVRSLLLALLEPHA